MKTTSYEISKQLKKNGLSEKLGFIDYYYNTDKQLRRLNQESYCSSHKENTQVDCFSYDLETILDALPAFIKNKEKEYHFWLWNDGMGYYPNYDKYSGEAIYNMENGIYEFSEDESLADTAARLWLKLKQEGLV